MQILDKVKDNPNICSVELGFSGELYSSIPSEDLSFYNSSVFAVDFTNTHIGLGSVSFAEESQESPAGTSYKQSVTIRFPSTDKNRSERIAKMDKVKFVKLNLTSGLSLVIGRNDFVQNARPRIKIKTNIKAAEVEFETLSIFPTGFVSDSNTFGLPALIPILLYL